MGSENSQIALNHLVKLATLASLTACMARPMHIPTAMRFDGDTTLDGDARQDIDAQETTLRRQLDGSGLVVVRRVNEIFLEIPNDIVFDIAGTVIRPEFQPLLNNVAATLRAYRATVIEVASYSDNLGTARFNQFLSQRRADTVKNYLTAQGIALSRVKAVGYGEASPRASNKTPGGRERNRRLTVILSPTGT